jgi:hypothetical protein
MQIVWRTKRRLFRKNSKLVGEIIIMDRTGGRTFDYESVYVSDSGGFRMKLVGVPS